MNANRYDVFLSYHHADRRIVEQIAQRLTETDIHPFLDTWNLVPGQPWQEGLEQAFSDCDSAAVFFGPAGLGPWQNEELRSLLAERVGNGRLRVIPVFLPGSTGDFGALPPFLRRFSAVDLREGLDVDSGFLRLVAGIRGQAPHAATGGENLCHPRIIHALPPAPQFIGRRAELEALGRFVNDMGTGVLAIIGLGGCGKTALAARFLESWSAFCNRPCDAFVWSFYEDQDTNAFLQELFHYASGGKRLDASGAGVIRLLVEELVRSKRPVLIVMDGLERVQRHLRHGFFGQIEDATLKHVLCRLAAGCGKAKCLITTRFPVTDLEPWVERGYHHIDADSLCASDARALLRAHGLASSDWELDQVVAEFGTHALTLDFVGIYLREFASGSLAKWREIGCSGAQFYAESTIRQERKLARVFSAYKTALTHEELSVLTHLCVFRFGVDKETLRDLFGASSDREPPLPSLTETHNLLERLRSLHLVLSESADKRVYTVHPAVRDYFYSLLAGPQELHARVGEIFAAKSLAIIDAWNSISEEVGEIESISTSAPDLVSWLRFTSSLLPQLPREEVDKLALLWEQVALKRGNERDAPLAERHGRLDEFLEFLAQQGHRLSPDQLLQLKEVWDREESEYQTKLRTHADAVSVRVEEFLATWGHELTPDEVLRLRLWRDGFQSPRGESATVITPSLTMRPGVADPTAKNTMDRIEELIHHLLAAGRYEAAKDIYFKRLGGPWNLGWNQGEYLRGLRILNEFPSMIDPAGYLRYRRGVGDLPSDGEFDRQSPGFLSVFERMHCNLLRGLLVRAESETGRFLRGETLSAAVSSDYSPRFQALLLQKRMPLNDSGANGATIQLLKAEYARLEGDRALAKKRIEEATQWIMRSGSQEHMCLLYLVEARLAFHEDKQEEAIRLCKEGLAIARQSSFGLLHIDLQLQLASSSLLVARLAGADDGDSGLSAARAAALTALNGLLADGSPSARHDLPRRDAEPDSPLVMIGAAHPECGYRWAIGEAYALLDQIGWTDQRVSE